jgi:hypothetical protein
MLHNSSQLGKRPYVKYSAGHLGRALKSIHSGNMYITQAEQYYQIPRQTLYNKMSGKHSKQPGRPPLFDKSEEGAFVRTLVSFDEYNWPLTKRHFLEMVNDFLADKASMANKPLPKTVGRVWELSFRRRWAHVLSKRVAEGLESSRTVVSSERVREFFGRLEKTYSTFNLHDKPCRIYNADEKPLSTGASTEKVYAKRGKKSVHAIAGPNLRQSYTLLGCVNAGGETLPPFVVYSSKRDFYGDWARGGPPGSLYATTETGWMRGPVF